MAELADAPDLGSGGTPVQVRFLSSAPNKDYYFDRMVVLIFCFMGFIGPFFGAFLKNSPAEQLKNAIAEIFHGGAFSLPTIFRWIYGYSLSLWRLSLDLWVFRYPYGGNRYPTMLQYCKRKYNVK